MIVLRVLLFLAGLALVLLMVRSMVRTFLVPRALQAHLSRAVFVLVRRVFRLRASERHDYAMRDRVMALYAPVALLTLLAVWFSLLLLGYSAMFFALGEVSPSEAFTLAGSSMLTLGFAHAARPTPASSSRSRPPGSAWCSSRCSSPTSRACTGRSSDASAVWPSSRSGPASRRPAST